MPAAVLGVLTLPFGLDQYVWTTMGWAVAAVLRLSAWVAGFPGSTVVTPAFGGGGLLLLALALLAGTLLGPRLRLLAVAPLLAGLSLAATAPLPDVYVARDGSGAAARRADGRLVVLGPVAAFTVEQWLRADGDSRRAADPSLRDAGRCDAIGCTAVLADGRAVSVVVDRRGFDADCRRAAILVSRLSAPPGCAASTILDRARLAEQGATTLRLTPSGLLAETVRQPGGRRPWLAPAPARPVSSGTGVPGRGEPAVAPSESEPPPEGPADEPR
jgi:competence protein ComEC